MRPDSVRMAVLIANSADPHSCPTLLEFVLTLLILLEFLFTLRFALLEFLLFTLRLARLEIFFTVLIVALVFCLLSAHQSLGDPQILQQIPQILQQRQRRRNVCAAGHSFSQGATKWRHVFGHVTTGAAALRLASE